MAARTTVAPLTQAIYVSPLGSDGQSGTTPSGALRTLQAALDRAQPGTVVKLAPGRYEQGGVTRVSGTATQPITIVGSGTAVNTQPRTSTVVSDIGRVLSINHSYYRLMGFTIDGEPAVAAPGRPTTPDQAAAYKDGVQALVAPSELVYVGADPAARYITGTLISHMTLTDAGTECVRIRDGARLTTITDSTIEWCGMLRQPGEPTTYRYHNGEGVYVGTSPKSSDQPMSANDPTSSTVIQHNVIRTFGSECVDVKENSHDNVVTSNVCVGNAEPMSYYGSALEIRGYRNTVTNNTVSLSLGFGVKLASDPGTFAQGANIVTQNHFSLLSGPWIVNSQTKAQTLLCGNVAAGVTQPATLAISGVQHCP
ncbi:MAG: right-handed parallel beta-helix repeat-containing protein [Actinomycetota bacterium]|nr:right-handed parallel beta-helix repeat-containing protein [Actinomycetota bacterium]